MGFQLVTIRFIVNPLTYCATQLGNNFEKEIIAIYKINIDLIVRVTYHLK